MVKIGINIIPGMPVKEIIETAVAAEGMGYEYLILADEGFMQDVYIVLGAIARETRRINLSPCTNGYTRHPAVTAAAMASLNELSGGRSFITLIAGGSVVLKPMNIARDAPLSVVRDTVEIQRLLWSGEKVSYQGRRYSISDAQITMGKQPGIPIWIAPRGEKMCQLAGEIGDGVMLMVKADLDDAFALVEEGSLLSGRNQTRIFLDRIAYTPAMIEDFSAFFPNVIADTPLRQVRRFMREEQIQAIQKELEEGGAEAAKALVTMEMLKGFKIAGTPEECSHTFRSLVDENRLDVFIVNIIASGLEKNLEYLRDIHKIIQDSGRLAVSEQRYGR